MSRGGEVNRLTDRRLERAHREAQAAQAARRPIELGREDLARLVADLRRQGQIVGGSDYSDPVSAVSGHSQPIPLLTPREQTVLRLYGMDLPWKRIMAETQLSNATISHTLASIREKFSAPKRDLRKWARRHAALIHPPGCDCPALWCSALRLGTRALTDATLPDGMEKSAQ